MAVRAGVDPHLDIVPRLLGWVSISGPKHGQVFDGRQVPHLALVGSYGQPAAFGKTRRPVTNRHDRAARSADLPHHAQRVECATMARAGRGCSPLSVARMAPRRVIVRIFHGLEATGGVARHSIGKTHRAGNGQQAGAWFFFEVVVVEREVFPSTISGWGVRAYTRKQQIDKARSAVGCGSWLLNPAVHWPDDHVLGRGRIGHHEVQPGHGMSSARAAASASRRSTGCRLSVTSWMVPPVCRLAVLRTVSSTCAGRISSAYSPDAPRSGGFRRPSECAIRRRWPPTPAALLLDQRADPGWRHRRPRPADDARLPPPPRDSQITTTRRSCPMTKVFDQHTRSSGTGVAMPSMAEWLVGSGHIDADPRSPLRSSAGLTTTAARVARTPDPALRAVGHTLQTGTLRPASRNSFEVTRFVLAPAHGHGRGQLERRLHRSHTLRPPDQGGSATIGPHRVTSV